MYWARFIQIFIVVGTLVLRLVTWQILPSQSPVEKTAAPINV